MFWTISQPLSMINYSCSSQRQTDRLTGDDVGAVQWTAASRTRHEYTQSCRPDVDLVCGFSCSARTKAIVYLLPFNRELIWAIIEPKVANDAGVVGVIVRRCAKEKFQSSNSVFVVVYSLLLRLRLTRSVTRGLSISCRKRKC